MRQFMLAVVIFTMFSYPTLGQNDEGDSLLIGTAGDIAVLDLGTNQLTLLADGTAFDPVYTRPDETTYQYPFVVNERDMVIFEDLYSGSLWYISAQTQPTLQRLTAFSLFVGFHPTFSPDGQRLLIPAISEDLESDALELWSLRLEDGDLNHLASLHIETGCGGGGFLPDEIAYQLQAGFLGNSFLLKWIADTTILVSSSCAGLGIQALNLETGEVSTVDSEMRRVVFDANQNTLAGITDQGLRLINLGTSVVQNYSFEDFQIDRLVWLPEGRLVFSATRQRGEIVLNPPDTELATDVLFTEQTNIPLYNTSLYVFNPASENLELIWSVDGWYGLPVISFASDRIYFSAVEDMERMVSALNNGSDFLDVVDARPSSNIYASLLQSGANPELLFEGGEFPTVYR